MKCNLKIIGAGILSILFAIFLTACGGGGGSGNNGGGTPNATIKGTVAGTVVVAVDENDNEVDRDTATGSPKSFTLTVPVGEKYRFFFIENEGTANERVFTLYQGTTNVFFITSAVIIDLGFVDTSTGVAVPENNPLDVSGVNSGGENTSNPSSLSGSAFTTNDLQGTWNYLGLISGDSPDQTPGWYWGSFKINSKGKVTFTSSVTDSLGNPPYTPTGGTFNISSSGIVTASYVNSFRGVMNKNKDMIVATATMAPGDSQGVNGYNLQIALKSGGTYDISDLQGTWHGHVLASGDSPQWIGWAYFKMTVDNNGNGQFISINRSDGNSTLPQPNSVSLSIASDGIITQDGKPSLHGVMSKDKNIIVMTMDDGGEGYDLLILQK